jgi:cytochrome P450
MTTHIARPLADDVEDWFLLRADASVGRWDVYRRLRDEAPQYAFRDQTLISKYADCLAILRDNRTFSSGFDPEAPAYQHTMMSLDGTRGAKYREILDHQLRWMTSSNGAKHVALRTLAARVFSVRAIEDMRGRIRAEVDQRLDELESSSSVEIMEEFAYQLPLTIISEMLDIPEDVRDSIHHSWTSMTQLIGNPPERVPHVIDEAHAGMIELEARLRETMRSRRTQKTTDLLARLLAAYDEQTGTLTERDIMGIIAQMVIAGHQTTQDTIGSALYELFRDRRQWDAIVGNASLIPNAVEEVLRFRTPGQMVSRSATIDTMIGECAVPAGTRVTCLLGAANRDASVFEDPERFDIRRANARQHLAFSAGNHFCLGASLSRMEVTIFLERFTARFPTAHPLPGGAKTEWLPNNFLLGLKRLDVALR